MASYHEPIERTRVRAHLQLVWMLFGLVALAIVVTYSRLSPDELYHTSEEALTGGLGRALLFSNFPTSLAAIAVIGAMAAAVHAAYGNVDLASGLLVALPAIAGVVAGAALQQRVPVRVVSATFAVLLVVSAALLVV